MFVDRPQCETSQVSHCDMSNLILKAANINPLEKSNARFSSGPAKRPGSDD